MIFIFKATFWDNTGGTKEELVSKTTGSKACVIYFGEVICVVCRETRLRGAENALVALSLVHLVPLSLLPRVADLRMKRQQGPRLYLLIYLAPTPFTED